MAKIFNPDTLPGAWDNTKYSGKPCYIIDYQTPANKLFFQTVPLEVNDSGSSTFTALPAFGVNYTNYQFTGAEDSLKFDITLYSDVTSRLDVVSTCKWLRGFTVLPEANQSIRPVIFAYGKLYTDSKWIIVEANYKFGQLNPTLGLPESAVVSLVLRRLSDSSPTANDIQKLTY